MNKYEKALETLKKIPNRIPLKSFTDDVVKEVDEAFVTLKELVNLTTPEGHKNLLSRILPKEPIKEILSMQSIESYIYSCPKCKSNLGAYRQANYCKKCGQAICWHNERKGAKR